MTEARASLGDLIPCDAPIEAVSERDAGGKGWNLFRLRAFGFPVPDWCVLSSRVLDRALEPHRVEIDTLLVGSAPPGRESLEAAASRVAQWLEAWPFPPALAAELAAAGERLAGGGALSVRSSVVGEDSASHSFAGLMESFLNVPPREVEAAIRKVWRSAFSARALAYRQRTGLAVTEISAAVIIQRMVSASAAGVLFTREPADLARESGVGVAGAGARRCVIAAALGLGEIGRAHV